MQYKERDIPTSYGDTHIITAGSPTQPPLLLLHGTGDHSAMMWIYNAKQLAEHFYIIAVDAIGGSGKSEPNKNYERTFDQTLWLDELLEALKMKETFIAGVSYGAYLAYHYATMRPSRVIRIVCMAGRIPSSSFEVMSKMIKAFMPEALFPSEKNGRRLLRKLGGPKPSPFEQDAELMHHWLLLLKHFNNRSMMKHKITLFSDEELQPLQERALFLIGDQDPLSYYPKAIQKLDRLQLPYIIMKSAGHAINHEQPKLVNDQIISFFKGEKPTHLLLEEEEYSSIL